jgi:branched-chain amino acid transport system substrate-binding protein
MYGGSGQAKSEFPTGAGSAADGFIFGTGKSLVPSNWGSGTPEFQVVDGFAKRYEAAYGSAPDIFAGHAFDALSILADSIKRASDTSPAALRDAVEQTKNLVGFGGSFTFSQSDHNGLTEKDLSLYKVGNTTWVTVQ